MNGDGKLDLLVTNAASGVVSVLLNTTPPGSTNLQFAPPINYAVLSGSGSAIVSDLNGDGRLDVIVANPFNKSVSVLANTQYETTIAGNPAIGTILRDIIFANGFE